MGLAAALEEDREQRFAARDAARQVERAEQRQWKKEQHEWLDEMLPKATGRFVTGRMYCAAWWTMRLHCVSPIHREAIIEKKLAAREAKRAREDSPDMPPGRVDLMGDGDDSFAAAKAREARRTEWRDKAQLAKREQLEQKISAAQEAENEKMAMFRSLVAQGPITIRKRE